MRSNKGTHRKSESLIVATQVSFHSGYDDPRNTFYQSSFPEWKKSMHLCSIDIVTYKIPFVNNFYALCYNDQNLIDTL